MKRKAILKEVTLNNPAFKMIVQQSADERKDTHEEIVQGAKDAGIVKGLSSSQKKIKHSRSVTISRNLAANKKVLKNRD